MSTRAIPNRGHSTRRPIGRAASSQRLSPLEFAALLLLGVALVYAAVTSSGAGAATTDLRTVTVRVEQSDTLWGLAARHSVDGLDTARTVQLIQEINHMSGVLVAAGELLIVPAAPDQTTALVSLD